MRTTGLLVITVILMVILSVGFAQANPNSFILIQNKSSVAYTLRVDGVKRGQIPPGEFFRARVFAVPHEITLTNDEGQTQTVVYNFVVNAYEVMITDKDRLPL